MTRKYFTELADMLATIKDEGGEIDHGTLALRLADFCNRHGANFDRGRFLAAAGL